MPIVSTLREVSTNANGSRQVVVRQYDQDGIEYMYSFHASADLDLDALIAGKTVDLNEQLAQNEFETLIGAEE